MNSFGRAAAGRSTAGISARRGGIRAWNQADVLAIADKVICASGREHPADAVLRLELKGRRDLQPEERTKVSKAVFAYYRWRGWLDVRKPVRDQLKCALELAQHYALEPQSFSDVDLLARAVPGWLTTTMQVTAPWVRALQREPRLWLRARSDQGRALAKKLGHCREAGEGLLADALEYCGQSDLYRLKEFHAGEFEVQDLSSQAAGLLCDPKPGQAWWDACAGEGGKTLHFSDLMKNRGLIWASDRSPRRLATLKRRAARAGVFNYRPIAWDGGPRLPTKTKFDGVLVDAPCSGIGTWHRNPHARWTTTAEDVKELAEVQRQLLLHAAEAVKQGGKLVYAACTLTDLETRGVVEKFAQSCGHFERLPLRNPLVPGSAPSDMLILWPQDAGGNGMAIVAWVRSNGQRS
jgi:16S rRNA (cytosine967-C5)-methyltransferase